MNVARDIAEIIVIKISKEKCRIMTDFAERIGKTLAEIERTKNGRSFR